MEVYCEDLTLGVLSSRSALFVLFGALFIKFRPLLYTPRISPVIGKTGVPISLCFIFVFLGKFSL
jgi:hypothetical protein